MDLQYLIRYLASSAVHNKFYFWGIHYTVKNGKPMRLADCLSRFLNDDSDFKNVKYINAIPIVNELLRDLIKYPRNLPSNIDISQQMRAAFGLLLDDGWVNHNAPYIRPFQPNYNRYNILNNRVKK